jgi:hypothetical protein
MSLLRQIWRENWRKGKNAEIMNERIIKLAREV